MYYKYPAPTKGFYSPAKLVPPHKITRPEQVDQLTASMEEGGWQGDPLVGYWICGELQLLTGTHRRAAADRANILVPVIVYSYQEVLGAYGNLEHWNRIIYGEAEAPSEETLRFTRNYNSGA